MGIMRGKQAAIDKIDAEVFRTQRAVGLATITRLTLETPVKDGRARSNWLADVGSFRRDINESNISTNGSYSQQQMNEALGRLRPGDRLTISNNLPYIQKLNQGSSDQAGKFFVQKIIADVQREAAAL